MVERKAKASRIRAAKQESRDSSKAVMIRQRDDSSSISSSSYPSSGLDMSCIPSSLPQCMENNAVCYFMNNYVLVSRHPDTRRGFMEHMPSFYTVARVESPLSLATTAIAMFSTRNVPAGAARRAMVIKAVAKYVEALRLINVAIQDPQEAKSDELLMAVLLLGLYEVSI